MSSTLLPSSVATMSSRWRAVQRRSIAVTVGGVRVWNVYVPNGQSVGSEKYAYKLDWLRRLRVALGDSPRARSAAAGGRFRKRKLKVT